MQISEGSAMVGLPVRCLCEDTHGSASEHQTGLASEQGETYVQWAQGLNRGFNMELQTGLIFKTSITMVMLVNLVRVCVGLIFINKFQS